MKKILIVDDEPAYSTLLREALGKTHEVLEATDGQQGLAVALRECPDLVIIDIQLPVMDGMTMLSKLRDYSYGKTADVVLLTNREPDYATLRRAIACQPLYYWVKGKMDMADVVEAVHDILYASPKLPEIDSLDMDMSTQNALSS